MLASFKKLPEIKTSSNWFKVYKVGKNVLAIIEPYNFEQAICYLILGKNKALLFDTGLGVDSISVIIKQLTKLPTIVLNSHTHYDHIGGNYEFENILSLNTAFSNKHAEDGWNHNDVKHEVTVESICLQKIPQLDTANYSIRPYKISKYITNGEIIDIGERQLKVISVPGHTPDAIVLYDKKNKYLWTGDTYYDGPIYLFANETDLIAYKKSVAKIFKLVPKLKMIFPSHNTPISETQRLVELKINFNKIINGNRKNIKYVGNTVIFDFKHFGFKINKEKLNNLTLKNK